MAKSYKLIIKEIDNETGEETMSERNRDELYDGFVFLGVPAGKDDGFRCWMEHVTTMKIAEMIANTPTLDKASKVARIIRSEFSERATSFEDMLMNMIGGGSDGE